MWSSTSEKRRPTTGLSRPPIKKGPGGLIDDRMLVSEVSRICLLRKYRVCSLQKVSRILASEVSSMLASKVSNMLASEVFTTPKLDVDDFAEQLQQCVSGLLDKLAPLKRMTKCCGLW